MVDCEAANGAGVGKSGVFGVKLTTQVPIGILVQVGPSQRRRSIITHDWEFLQATVVFFGHGGN